MRPTRSDIFLTGMLGAGIALSTIGVATGGQVRFPGMILLAGAAGWGVTGLLRLRGQCRRVAAALSEAGNAKDIEPQKLQQIAPTALGQSLTDSLSAARRHALDAELHAREFEIRYKIADAEREHAQAIIYSISDAVVVTDPFDDVVLANESAARTFEFELDAAARRTPVGKLVRDPKVIDLIRQMRQAGGKGGRRVVEHQVTHGDVTRTYKITLSTVADKAEPTNADPHPEEMPGVVAVLHDVTHEREIAQMKTDFVSNVSHELRTPLASIKAYVELLIDGEAQDETTKREFYDVIQNEANRLGRLIDNILNISKIESGLVKIDRKPQSLAVIIKDAMEVIQPQADRKQIKIQESLTPVFYQVLADRDMLYQAVLNLLSNAVKYTPEGGEVRVESRVDEQTRKVLTQVTDNGVGIPPQDLPFIFDKFFRAESNAGMANGTGLGLPLVKHIVETVHAGRLTVESQRGKGSTFGFELELSE